jgi:integrase
MATYVNAELTLQHLQQQRGKFTAAMLAKNTRKGYLYDWAAFTRFTAAMGFTPLPASSETVALFVVAQIDAGLKVSTATHRVAAIRRQHLTAGQSSPTTQEVADVLHGARRSTGDRLRQVLPLTIPALREIALLLLADGTPHSARDLAILLTGFTGALRSSSNAALMFEDVEFCAEGALLQIWREKNRQEATEPRFIGLPHAAHSETCASTALKRYIEIRGNAPGPLFTRFDTVRPKDCALQPERIGQIVQKNVRRIGLDWKLYGGHSLRRGFTTAAGIAGGSTLLIASQTGHRHMDSVERYFRKNVWVANPARLLDL